MKEVEYSEAAAEVLYILNFINLEDVKKIPKSFINFLHHISNNNYIQNIKHETQINKMNLKKHTKELLGFIYITWLSNESERKNYKEIIFSNTLKINKMKG